MIVKVKLFDEVYGEQSREYDFPGLKRMPAICRAMDKIRNDNSLRMYKIDRITTAKSSYLAGGHRFDRKSIAR